MARLRGVHRGKREAAKDAADARDGALVDLGQRLERQAAQVKVGSSFGAVLKSLGLDGGKRIERSGLEQVEGGGNRHGTPPQCGVNGILYLFIQIVERYSTGCR